MTQTPSPYLLAMPDAVLFGEARVIERYCAERDKVRPTLLDLGLARAMRREERGR